MKSPILLFAFFLITRMATGQGIAPAPADKAVVYFVRTSSMGFAINFSYFDSTQLIGKFNGPKYIRYECEPGAHLFWAHSENGDYVEADVEAGKIYFIEAIPKMGALKAAVELEPVDTKDQKKMEKIIKLLNKKPSESFTQAELAADRKELGKPIENDLRKYQEKKAQGKPITQLTKTMAYIQP